MHLSEPRVSVLEVPVDFMKGVKTSARQQEVRTLHPVLHTVALAALKRTFLASSHETMVVVETPASLRSLDLGHPNVLGNFIADYKHTYPFPISDSFWELARCFAQDIKDPSSRRHAIGQMGLLAHIPDTPPRTNEDGSKGDSGWEIFFRRRIASEKPSGTSLTLSNLGVIETEVDLLGQGVHVAWAQTPSASGAAITMNVSTILHSCHGYYTNRDVVYVYGRRATIDKLHLARRDVPGTRDPDPSRQCEGFHAAYREGRNHSRRGLHPALKLLRENPDHPPCLC
jgi:hypothetical protein